MPDGRFRRPTRSCVAWNAFPAELAGPLWLGLSADPGGFFDSLLALTISPLAFLGAAP
jgi:hypothetical protein